MRLAAGGGDGEEVLQHVSKLVQALHLRPEDVSLELEVSAGCHTLTAVLWHFKRDSATLRDASVGLDPFLSQPRLFDPGLREPPA